uniref:Uncharacterized protein n=1 Tax=Zea mays TaxID=4577 RepID=A0A804NAI2_MAIZE
MLLPSRRHYHHKITPFSPPTSFHFPHLRRLQLIRPLTLASANPPPLSMVSTFPIPIAKASMAIVAQRQRRCRRTSFDQGRWKCHRQREEELLGSGEPHHRHGGQAGHAGSVVRHHPLRSGALRGIHPALLDLHRLITELSFVAMVRDGVDEGPRGNHTLHRARVEMLPDYSGRILRSSPQCNSYINMMMVGYPSVAKYMISLSIWRILFKIQNDHWLMRHFAK